MKKYKCGKCSRKGHNARTCKKKVPARKKTTKKKTGRKKATKKKTTRKKTTKKKTTRKKMSRTAKVGRWGKIVGRYKSKSSDKTYAVRRKGSTYSCNCPGWVFKRKGKARSCRHTKMAQASGKRGKRSNKRKLYSRKRRYCRH